MRLQHILLSTVMATVLPVACTQAGTSPKEQFEQAVSSIRDEVDTNVALVEWYLNALITAGVQGVAGANFQENIKGVPAGPSDVKVLIADGNRTLGHGQNIDDPARPR